MRDAFIHGCIVPSNCFHIHSSDKKVIVDDDDDVSDDQKAV